MQANSVTMGLGACRLTRAAVRRRLHAPSAGHELRADEAEADQKRLLLERFQEEVRWLAVCDESTAFLHKCWWQQAGLRAAGAPWCRLRTLLAPTRLQALLCRPPSLPAAAPGL